MSSLASAKAKWTALTTGQRFALIVVAVLLGIGAFVMQSKANQKDWAVLYANVDDATASSVLEALDSRGIEHQLDGNGTRILVLAGELDTTRLALASEGVSGQTLPKGFDEIFSNQGLTSSDFEQRVNFERALEGELARTLLAMDPVAGANVQLSIPQESIFVGDGDGTVEKPSASVLLSLDRPLSSGEIDTVTNFVASAVEGLTPEEVTIASSDGALLHAAGTDVSDANLGRNMEVTREYESELSTRLTALAQSLTGQLGARVEVRAELDFTESTVEQEVIDPSQNTPIAEHETTEEWTGSGSGVGGTTGVEGAPVEPTGDGTYEKTDKTTTYVPGDRTITHSTSSTPTVTRLSIAVVVPVPAETTDADAADEGGSTTTKTETTTEPVDEEMVSRVLGSAAGLDEDRGDSIEVALVAAVAGDLPALATEPAAPVQVTVDGPLGDIPPTKLASYAAAAGAIVMLALALSMRRRRRRKEILHAALTGEDRPVSAKRSVRARKADRRAGDATEPTPVSTSRAPAKDADLVAIEEIRGDLERMLAESPESLAALLGSWLTK